MRVPLPAILFFLVSSLFLIGGFFAYSYERTLHDAEFHWSYTFYPYRGIGMHLIAFGFCLGIVGAILPVITRRKGEINWIGVAIATLGTFFIVSGLIRYAHAYTLAWTFFENGPYGPPQRIPCPQEKSAGISMMVLGVALIAHGVGFSYVMHGQMLEDRRAYQPSVEKLDVETQTKYPRVLFARYAEQYPHNPEGVLEWHIHKKTKEGKTREQAIKELMQA